MGFYFVDKIESIQANSIEGWYHSHSFDPYRLGTSEGGERPVAPAVLGEAIGQLASWLVIHQHDFAVRPVFAAAERIHHHQDLSPGCSLRLTATIEHASARWVKFSGRAYCGEQLVHAVDHCLLSLIAMAEMEDPALCRERFALLRSQAGVGASRLSGQRWRWDDLEVSMLPPCVPDQRQVRLRLGAACPAFRDHFPRSPVVPAAVLNEIIAVQAARMARGPGHLPSSILVEKCKVRDFLRPDEWVQLDIIRLPEANQGASDSERFRVQALKGEQQVISSLWTLIFGS